MKGNQERLKAFVLWYTANRLDSRKWPFTFYNGLKRLHFSKLLVWPGGHLRNICKPMTGQPGDETFLYPINVMMQRRRHRGEAPKLDQYEQSVSYLLCTDTKEKLQTHPKVKGMNYTPLLQTHTEWKYNLL